MRHQSRRRASEFLGETDASLLVLLAPRNRLFASPEMRLAAAVLVDAVACVMENAGARRGPRWHEFVEARRWFFDDRREWPFSFANVCDLFDLDAAAVRERLQRQLAQPGDKTPPDTGGPRQAGSGKGH